ncbi:MAG: glycosyltransferase, partial [Candidatus Sericytochromatia bacterium]
MRVLISGVGTRGDVQPVLALAVALREQGHEASVCVPPNFVDWATRLGFAATPVGVEMRAPGRATGPAPTPPPRPEDLVGSLVGDQFTQVRLAVVGCDLVVGAGTYQFAAHSIAELLGLPYLNAVYAAVSIPSRDLPPRANPGEIWQAGEPAENLRRWEADAQSWNDRYLALINQNRQALGLRPVEDVRTYILGERPLLAADLLLGHAPEALGMTVVSTGAWLLTDSEPLSPELEAFLAAGEPPIYFGFGSMPAAPNLGSTVLETARKLRRRAIVSQGWADFDPLAAAPDHLLIRDVN